ncbi:MAG: DnaJ domain-containing protein [Spirochaetaceae bacterium]|nr:DnaJ domain-containing protein [Spirochaetaceae bacterium]
MLLFNEVKNHYEVLGLANTAGDDEIKRAYFTMVRRYQPDRFPEEFKEIRAAYETLRDREKRAEYDAIGELPPSIASFFHEAQRLDRFGRHDRAAELYRMILKSRPELDNIREKYAVSLSAGDKTGKAAEVWEELCRRRPDNPRYARELGRCYFDRGWHKKAMAEARRSLTLERASIDGWSLAVSCALESLKNGPGALKELGELLDEALEAVQGVTASEWEKIYLHTHAFLVTGLKNVSRAKNHLREIIRLIREGGRNGQNLGQWALNEIFMLIPAGSLALLYPDLTEMANLLPDIHGPVREKLKAVRLSFEIENLEEKKFSGIFTDLFRILNAGFEEDEDELNLTAMEYHLLKDKTIYDPQIRRLKREFPELYALHGSFFDTVLRTRDPEKLLYQRSKKIEKLHRQGGFEEEPDSAPPSETVRRSQPKVGRNDPCPCGSGKKYKHCCGA